jgi:hypothetical protein
MFEKINLSFNSDSLEEFKDINPCSIPSKRFIEYSVLNKDLLMRVISKKLKFNILPDFPLFTEILEPGVYPHCDKWKTAMNIYLSAGENDITNFYTIKNLEPNNNINKTTVFNPDSLEKQISFIANKGDCYLLNTHVPHDIKIKEPGSKRLILRFVWERYSFEEIRKSIILL